MATKEELQQKLATLTQQLASCVEYEDISEKGKILATLNNLRILMKYYNIKIRYNEMIKETEIDIPKVKMHGDTRNNVQITHIKDLARQTGLPADPIPEMIETIANENAYHPVREWISSIKWDGKSRLEEYYATIDSPSPMKKTLMRKWALSAVAAVFREEFQFGAEGVLILLGDQGQAKTTWATTLLPRFAVKNSWVITGCTVDPHNKDTLLIALSGWITEMGEIGTSFRKSDKESMKQFTTQKVDKLRPPYAAKPNTYSRRTVFYGTSNEFLILNDTENRRFWPLEDVKFPTHNLDVEQFWAEMYEMYKQVLPLMDTRQDSIRTGEWGWYLSPSEKKMLAVEQEDFKTVNHIVEILEHNLQPPTATGCEYLGATIILQKCGMQYPNRANANEAASYLKAKGYPYQKNTKKFGVVFKDLENSNSAESGNVGSYEDLKKSIAAKIYKK